MENHDCLPEPPKTLKVGIYQLNESLSKKLYEQVKKWKEQYLGGDFTFVDCQWLLDRYHYTIDWYFRIEEENGVHETYFFVTILNPVVRMKQLKGYPYFVFELGMINRGFERENDSFLSSIIEMRNSRN